MCDILVYNETGNNFRSSHVADVSLGQILDKSYVYSIYKNASSKKEMYFFNTFPGQNPVTPQILQYFMYFLALVAAGFVILIILNLFKGSSNKQVRYMPVMMKN